MPSFVAGDDPESQEVPTTADAIMDPSEESKGHNFKIKTEDGEYIHFGTVDSEKAATLRQLSSKRGSLSVDAIINAKKGEVAAKQHTKFLMLIIAGMAALIGVLALTTFAASFAAMEMSKEMHATTSGNSVALTADDGSRILETRPAEYNLGLQHTIVMDMDHLRTVDEITYNYQGREISERVISVEKYQGSGVASVTFVMESQNVISVQVDGAFLMKHGVSRAIQLCGLVKCANFKVDDPELDPAVLDGRLATLQESWNARRSRRLDWGTLETGEVHEGCKDVGVVEVVERGTDPNCAGDITESSTGTGYYPGTDYCKRSLVDESEGGVCCEIKHGPAYGGIT